jgi:aspartyl-tRNA(Asn)/glutamyl-tRNA(Gln) amidotransferase subunit A
MNLEPQFKLRGLEIMAITARELRDLSAVQITELVKAGDLSAKEIVEAALERMDAFEPHVHAYCTPGHDLARASAVALDERIARGEVPGPLAGVPIGIKDLVATKDLTTAMGSAMYRDFLPDEDDIVIERLKAADAIIVGKTNVPEFGYSGAGHNPVFETSRNPWNLEFTPGGSSSGSAASVACGVTPFAIGTDGGGSIRIPAALCGLFGMKASMGRVPLYPGCRDERYPGISSWESLEHIGPISRTVGDAALMLATISGPDMRDRHSLPKADFDWFASLEGDLDGLRVAYSEDWGYAAVEPVVRDICRNAVKVFERDFGCIVEEASPGWDDPLLTFWSLVAADSDLAGMRAWLPDHAHEMSPHLVDFLMRPWTAEDLTNANMARQAVCNRMAKFMARYDLLLTPTIAIAGFPVHMQGPEIIDGQMVSSAHWLPFTFPMNMTGQPAATVPAGFTPNGLPVGLQIVGRHLDDPLVLRASHCFEQARPWSDAWPDLVQDAGL